MEISDFLKAFMWFGLYGTPFIIILGIIIFIVRLIKSKPNFDDVHLSDEDKKEIKGSIMNGIKILLKHGKPF